MKNIALLFLILLPIWAQAQDSIPILNGSFEGEEQGAHSTMPQGWMGCTMGTTPDILPGAWGVLTPPAHGQTYIGIITRDDGTNEAIGQRLLKPMKPSTCYSFKLSLAHSTTYSGYNLPVRVRVWASTKSCQLEQLLWESDLINNPNWETFEVKFYTKKAHRFIIIEAYFAPGVYIRYRGNVLVDNITNLIQCDGA